MNNTAANDGSNSSTAPQPKTDTVQKEIKENVVQGDARSATNARDKAKVASAKVEAGIADDYKLNLDLTISDSDVARLFPRGELSEFGPYADGYRYQSGAESIVRSTDIGSGENGFGYYAGRFGSGVAHALIGVVTEPVLQVYDMAAGLTSFAYNETAELFTGKNPLWFPETYSGISHAYENGASQFRLLAQSNPITGVGVTSYDMTSSGLNGQWGDFTEQAGGLAGGFIVGKAVSKYGGYGLAFDDIGVSGLGRSQAGAINLRLTEPQSRVQANKAAGDAWESEVINNVLPETQTNIQPQISIRSNGPSGLKVRLDSLGSDMQTNQIMLSDMKASQSAPHTPNQKVVYPELELYGGVVVGKGKPPYVGGTNIPPSAVQIIRKP